MFRALFDWGFNKILFPFGGSNKSFDWRLKHMDYWLPDAEFHFVAIILSRMLTPLARTPNKPSHITYMTQHMVMVATLIIIWPECEACNRTGEIQLARDTGQPQRIVFKPTKSTDANRYGISDRYIRIVYEIKW